MKLRISLSVLFFLFIFFFVLSFLSISGRLFFFFLFVSLSFSFMFFLSFLPHLHATTGHIATHCPNARTPGVQHTGQGGAGYSTHTSSPRGGVPPADYLCKKCQTPGKTQIARGKKNNHTHKSTVFVLAFLKIHPLVLVLHIRRALSSELPYECVLQVWRQWAHRHPLHEPEKGRRGRYTAATQPGTAPSTAAVPASNAAVANRLCRWCPRWRL